MSKVQDFLKFVRKYNLGEIKEEVDFKKITSLKIGGICEALYIPSDLESLTICLKYLKENNIRYYLLGHGTNILVNDIYFEMVLISLKKFNDYYLWEETLTDYYFYVEAGVSATTFSRNLVNHNIEGIEFLGVIPGSIGGLTFMNAGAYKKSISDLIYSVSYFDEFGYLQTALNKDNYFNFSYRDSIFKNTQMIIISIVMKIPKNISSELPIIKLNRYLKQKQLDQPLDSYNAGSTFKNNNENYYAWQIVDKLGYRGKKIGDAMVSNKHANFIINSGNAKFLDMITLIQMIKYDAKNKLGINLECEWEILQ